jgi:hypothetical protein
MTCPCPASVYEQGAKGPCTCYAKASAAYWDELPTPDDAESLAVSVGQAAIVLLVVIFLGGLFLHYFGAA